MPYRYEMENLHMTIATILSILKMYSWNDETLMESNRQIVIYLHVGAFILVHDPDNYGIYKLAFAGSVYYRSMIYEQ